MAQGTDQAIYRHRGHVAQHGTAFQAEPSMGREEDMTGYLRGHRAIAQDDVREDREHRSARRALKPPDGDAPEDGGACRVPGATVRKPTVRSSPLDDAWKNQLSREQLFSGRTLMKHIIFSNGCSYDSRPFRHSFWESLGAWPSEREPHTSLWRGFLFIETADS
jgi:hypothetical protein